MCAPTQAALGLEADTLPPPGPLLSELLVNQFERAQRLRVEWVDAQHREAAGQRPHAGATAAQLWEQWEAADTVLGQLLVCPLSRWAAAGPAPSPPTSALFPLTAAPGAVPSVITPQSSPSVWAHTRSHSVAPKPFPSL
jgi:hypothetical protein